MNTELEGLQAALRAEHGAIWGYGVVGAAAAVETRVAVRDVESAHRVRRGELADLIRLRGGEPDPARAAYELPFPVNDPTSAFRLAAELEAGVARGHAFAVSQAVTQRAKAYTLAALTDAALAQTGWRQLSGAMPATPEFPGL